MPWECSNYMHVACKVVCICNSIPCVPSKAAQFLLSRSALVVCPYISLYDVNPKLLTIDCITAAKKFCVKTAFAGQVHGDLSAMVCIGHGYVTSQRYSHYMCLPTHYPILHCRERRRPHLYAWIPPRSRLSLRILADTLHCTVHQQNVVALSGYYCTYTAISF